MSKCYGGKCGGGYGYVNVPYYGGYAYPYAYGYYSYYGKVGCPYYGGYAPLYWRK